MSFWLIFVKFNLIPKLSNMKCTLILVVFCCVSPLLYAQKTLSGRVTDRSSGGILVGASIKVKGSARGVSTGSDGNFALPVNKGDILIISNIGYSPFEMAAPDASFITIPLEPLSAELTQVVF